MIALFAGSFEMHQCEIFITINRKTNRNDEEKIAAKETNKGCRAHNIGSLWQRWCWKIDNRR